MKWKECDVRDGKGVVSSGKGSRKVKQEEKFRDLAARKSFIAGFGKKSFYRLQEQKPN